MPATGPVTPEGRQRAAGNALRHGLTARKFVLLPDEDPALFQALVDELLGEWGPLSATQTDLVERIAVQRWRLMRAAGLEAGILAEAGLDEDTRLRRLATIGRYVRAIELSLRQHVLDLERLARLSSVQMIERVMAGAAPPAAAAPPGPAARPQPAFVPAQPASPHPNRAERRRLARLDRGQERRAA